TLAERPTGASPGSSGGNLPRALDLSKQILLECLECPIGRPLGLPHRPDVTRQLLRGLLEAGLDERLPPPLDRLAGLALADRLRGGLPEPCVAVVGAGLALISRPRRANRPS